MAEAKITLQLTAQEFDTLRNALRAQHENEFSIAQDRDADVALKTKSRRNAAYLSELLAKLQ